MKIAVLSFDTDDADPLLLAARELERGFKAAGHEAVTFRASRESSPSGHGFDLACVGCRVPGLVPKRVPDAVRRFFSASRGWEGKRAIAFTVARPLFRDRALALLLRAVEAEGLRLVDQAIFSRPLDAFTFASSHDR